MNPLLIQFIQEARDFLQGIGAKLIELEETPDSVPLITDLFRLVHTLKGNSGLFEFPEMTRVLHAGEDLMDAVRDGRVPYSGALADQLLDAMDFVSALIDEIDNDGHIHAEHAGTSDQFSRALRSLIPAAEKDGADVKTSARVEPLTIPLPELKDIPEVQRMSAWCSSAAGDALFLISYRPDEDCFFKGEDPFHISRQVPGLIWGNIVARQAWPKPGELDCYHCQIDFQLLVAATLDEVTEYFRYTPEQIRIAPVNRVNLILPEGHVDGGDVFGDFACEALLQLEEGALDDLRSGIQALIELSAPGMWVSSLLRWLLLILETSPDQTVLMSRLIESIDTLKVPDLTDLEPAHCVEEASGGIDPGKLISATPSLSGVPPYLKEVLRTQADILQIAEGDAWQNGRLRACAATIAACMASVGESPDEVFEALDESLRSHSCQPLRDWFLAHLEGMGIAVEGAAGSGTSPLVSAPTTDAGGSPQASRAGSGADSGSTTGSGAAPELTDPKFGRRAEDGQAGKILKVDQVKVDRLMNLIGEMVVAKNSLPYLANRAENQYRVRELSREIKAQYSVINRIAEEMQDAIMQVRMMPVSFIFQRFPRLVRDISRKLGKDVELVLEGEDTEADKNIVEALADPLIHIVRNSLDHGLEMPQDRVAAGKSPTGRLTIRAMQESDRVLIEIMDDGHGINPDVIKRKAYEKGFIDEAAIERLSDQEAINLIFAAGFSTAEAVTDLSGRGVGMDVVKNAIDKVGGSVELTSQVNKGTCLRLSLPLSMAVTNVMIVESDKQIFGVPMDLVVETVRLPSDAISTIKSKKTTVLRGRIVPLVTLNELLAIYSEPVLNSDSEFAILVVRVGSEQVGLVVDDFREVVDVILKPLPGDLANLSGYAGSALLGDGSVLMVLNPKELF